MDHPWPPILKHRVSAYLRCLAENEDAVGLDTLAATLGESTETLEESVEPFLLRQGLIQRTARGRLATHKGRQVLAEVTE